MKKKVSKKKKHVKQKIDVVLESLLNLELRVKELIKRIDQLETFQKQHYPKYPDTQYWPNIPYRYDGVTWIKYN